MSEKLVVVLIVTGECEADTSLSFCRGSRVEGSMSRARVPCRGLRVTIFFSNLFFLEKVIIDAINVIKSQSL